MSKFSNASLLAQDEKVSDQQLVEEMKLLSFQRSTTRMNRRNFVTTLAAGAAAAGIVGCSSGSVPVTSSNSTPAPLDVLNFALNLEYLEASFYLYVTTGNGLSSTDTGGTNSVTGGAKVTFTNSFVSTIAQNLATDEQAHVEFLRSTINSVFGAGSAVPMPNLNLAAMGAVTNDATFLALARALETTGISAYAGGAQYLVSNTTALTYAAQILDTEAQHEGVLRQACVQLGVTSPAVDSMDTPPTATAIFNTSPTTGFNPVRTPSQVLQIVYATPGVLGTSAGGFFPNGLTGNIHTS